MSTGTESPIETPSVETADEAGTAPGDRRFRPDVEGLRAIAVILVVLYHGDIPRLHGGYVGVDVFFVISGFVITGLLLRERTSTSKTSLLAFYGRRCRRILPAATLVIVATVVTSYVVLGVVFADPTAVAARWTAVFLANFHFASIGTDYLNANQPPSPLLNFWSLAVEEQFYLVYPTIFLVVAGLRSRLSLRTRLVVALVPIVVLSLLWSIVQTHANPTAAYYSPLTRAWELALGALIACGTPWLIRLRPAVAASMTWIGVAAIGVAAFAYSASTPYPGILVAVPVVGAGLVIAGGTSVPRSGVEALLRLPPFQWFGRHSYSLYLWHWPILIIAADEAGKTSLPFRQNILWLVLAVVLSIATYRLIENPVRHARAFRGRSWLPVGVGVVLVGTSLVVATVALDAGGAQASSVDTASYGHPGNPLARGTALSAREVARMVAAAPSIRTLPANLAPALGKVGQNWGGPFGPCDVSEGQSSIPACVFGDPNATRTVVLYGDSHAAMWFEAMNLIALGNHWKLVFLVKDACPAVDLPFGNPTGFGTPGGEYSSCDEWHRFALERIRRLEPDVVVITQEVDAGPNYLLYSANRWKTAMTKTIGELGIPASHVVVLGNIPEFIGQGPECLALHTQDVQECSGKNSSYVVAHNAAELQATTRVGARYINVVPWFCSSTCTDVVGRYQPYWDGHHINADYSFALISVLNHALDLTAYPPSG
jgi:peptidoglycan/LPS O-acetylase OafA/YrhL